MHHQPPLVPAYIPYTVTAHRIYISFPILPSSNGTLLSSDFRERPKSPEQRSPILRHPRAWGLSTGNGGHVINDLRWRPFLFFIIRRLRNSQWGESWKLGEYGVRSQICLWKSALFLFVKGMGINTIKNCFKNPKCWVWKFEESGIRKFEYDLEILKMWPFDLEKTLNFFIYYF